MMTPAAFQQIVDQFRNRTPFQPFVIVLDAGERIVIEEPEEFGCYLGSAVYCDAANEMYYVDAEEVANVIELSTASP